jgi:hypothetical protein
MPAAAAAVAATHGVDARVMSFITGKRPTSVPA